MIPWMREKFAERRARWLASRKRSETSKNENDFPTTPPPLLRQQLNGQTTPASLNENLEARVRSQSLIGVNRNPGDLTTNTTITTTTAESSSSAPVTPQRRTGRLEERVVLAPQCARLKNLKSRHCHSASASASPQNSVENTSAEDTTTSTTKERIRIRVICPSARVLVFQIDTSKRLTELKNEVILELSDDPASMPLFATDMRQLSPRYRLFRANFEGVELNETLTLNQLQIQNHEALVLTPRRTYLHQASVQARDTKAPRDQEIEVATRNVSSKNSQMPMVDVNEIFQQSNIQFDVRKVLISLAQASAAVIGAGPYATRLIAMLRQKLINKRNYQKDTQQCLVDMGFTQEQADYALRVHNGVYSSALEYLLQHQSDKSTDDRPMALQKSSSILSPSGIITNDDIMQNTAALLEIVRIYSHRDIPPTPETVEALTEMGFDEADVMIALKKTCNNKAAACEWLCGNRTGSLIELRDGLAQDSPILKTILELPQVQMNLSNPKILLAFLAILENENSIRVWGGDNDTTSVITHILQKYHEEKHVLGINQFYSDRI